MIIMSNIRLVIRISVKYNMIQSLPKKSRTPAAIAVVDHHGEQHHLRFANRNGMLLPRTSALFFPAARLPLLDVQTADELIHATLQCSLLMYVNFSQKYILRLINLAIHMTLPIRFLYGTADRRWIRPGSVVRAVVLQVNLVSDYQQIN